MKEVIIIERITFNQLDLSDALKKATEKMGFKEATPVQGKAIPYILEGHDLIAQAPTGTGKTCAFGAPIIDRIDTNNPYVQALILSPTRELTIQISEELKALSKYKKGVKVLPIYGGQSIDRQIRDLRNRPQIVIGTPGRVMDHMRRGTLNFEHLSKIVLDEADEMLNMGFREDIDIILESVPEDRQVILFSATLPKAIMDIAKTYQHHPVKISLIQKSLAVSTVEQRYVDVKEDQKMEVLARLLDVNHFRLSVVFCNTKKRVDDVCRDLQNRGYAAEALHGDMRQLQRDSVMGKFRKGHVSILVATDVAARGIDVDEVDAVFNYDIPLDEEYYVHRIGRTGRANRKGISYSFVTYKDIQKMHAINRYTKSKMERIVPPSVDAIKASKIETVIEKVKASLTSKEELEYAQLVEKIEAENDFTMTELAATLLGMVMEQTVMGSDETVVLDKMNYGKERHKSMEDMRLFINLGKKDGLRKTDLAKLLMDQTGLQNKHINNISILEKFSFFEIPGAFVTDLIKKMSKRKVKGRRVNVEVANRKR